MHYQNVECASSVEVFRENDSFTIYEWMRIVEISFSIDKRSHLWTEYTNSYFRKAYCIKEFLPATANLHRCNNKQRKFFSSACLYPNVFNCVVLIHETVTNRLIHMLFSSSWIHVYKHWKWKDVDHLHVLSHFLNKYKFSSQELRLL